MRRQGESGYWACPSNRLVTEPSSKTSRIALLIRGEIESTES
jgi:hypothetical protein